MSDCQIAGGYHIAESGPVVAIMESDRCPPDEKHRLKPGVFLKTLIDRDGDVKPSKYPERLNVLGMEIEEGS